MLISAALSFFRPLSQKIKAFGNFHGFLPQFLIVHVEVSLEEENSAQLIGPVVLGAFQELHINAKLPPPISEAGGVCKTLNRCVQG